MPGHLRRCGVPPVPFVFLLYLRAVTRKMVAGSRIGPELASAANAASISRAIVLAGRFGGLLLLDQPRRRSHHQRLLRFFLGAAADDRRVRPLDRDLGEPGPRENPTDIVGVGEGERAGRVGGCGAGGPKWRTAMS